MSEAELHPNVAPIAFLLGTWRGEGKGEYPTIDPFAYREEVTFTHTGKPFIAYSQRTWHPEKGFPMHTETGYVRPLDGGRVEVVIVQPTGIVEIQEGTVEGTAIQVSSTLIGRTSTAKEVTALERTLAVDGDVLRYEVRMAAVGQQFQHHLGAELRKTAG